MNLFQNPNLYRNQQQNQQMNQSQAENPQQQNMQNNMSAQNQENIQPETNPNADISQQQTASSGASQNWMNNPALSNIDPAKLQMLTSLASQAQGKSQNELLPFLMGAASQSQSNNMSFQPDEIDTIINVMKIGKSPQEIQRIDRLCALMRQFRR